MDYKHSTLLGQQTAYDNDYEADLLTAIPRAHNREHLDFNNAPVTSSNIPFYGMDFWTAYEVSWLNEKGKPQVALANIVVPADSPNIIESKSLKLYLNSFNFKTCASMQAAQKIMEDDLTASAGKLVMVALHHVHDKSYNRQLCSGTHLDELDITINHYAYSPKLLEHSIETNHIVQEIVYTDLFRSNCPVTNQPDWATIHLSYEGPKIDHEKLLAYLVSFRDHQGFHEAVIERIFMDLLNYCKLSKLSVKGYFTRRGGLDINPHRSNFETLDGSMLMHRQ